MSYSIGVNVVPERYLDDLNALLKILVPIAREMPWGYWVNIMRSGTELITCFDDKEDKIIGMTSVVYINKPSGNFANICDTVILEEEYISTQIRAKMMIKGADLIKEKGYVLL